MKHRVYYKIVEVTEWYQDIEADSPDEAERLVSDYEVDLKDGKEFDSIRYEVIDVEVNT